MAKLTIKPKDALPGDLIGSQMDLIEQLVEFRKLRGMTQSEVASRMGVDRSVVTKFESLVGLGKKNHTMKMIRAYANSVEAYVAHFVVDGRIQHGSAPYAEFKENIARRITALANANEAHEQFPDAGRGQLGTDFVFAAPVESAETGVLQQMDYTMEWTLV
ncbi:MULTISPECIES: helix-turn-helix domain-containing protein [Corynebacterium]|jgi:transcriptional regulator with XRE-family HTH domain|uniref:helix-turn-helix domain-containing protein n=1 Tax=Corynebacterium TaxID=1716 RepID=UPI0006672512|nr:helix-turn-helix transcriptional regulator [Corynebacterium striatum]